MSDNRKKVVIVGGVAGGATLATRLRRLSETVEIVLLERGQYISYANCGLPYYAGGLIRKREKVLVLSPEQLREIYNVKLGLGHEVIGIDRQNKTVRVQPRDAAPYDESYDLLVLSPGASPQLPDLPGLDSRRVTTLWTVPEADFIRQQLDQGQRNVILVGAGPIGLELAEVLIGQGARVQLVQRGRQVMDSLDMELAALAHGRLREKGVELHLGEEVKAFAEEGAGLAVSLASGKRLHGDFAVLGIGVRPNVAFAREAGLAIGERGGLLVDRAMRTSDPAIYAIGDAVEVPDFVFGQSALYQLAGPVAKQTRIAAANIINDLGNAPGHELGGQVERETYSGTQGTGICKVFDLALAVTGHNESSLKKRGLLNGRDYHTAVLVARSHASYYPGAQTLALKLIFSPDGKQIYGAQAVGAEGADKRLDVISSAMRLGAGIMDLQELELAYSPPYSSPKDPVNLLGHVAQNVMDGLARFCDWDTPDEAGPDQPVFLDIRQEKSRRTYPLPGSINITMEEIRSRLDELPRERRIITICETGLGSYETARILMQHGFSRVWVYPGGIYLYQATHGGPRPEV